MYYFFKVRATNLQELVYKNGQAGVTKATVSITFDNQDKKQSPLGYEQYDEITITRQVGVHEGRSIMNLGAVWVLLSFQTSKFETHCIHYCNYHALTTCTSRPKDSFQN